MVQPIIYNTTLLSKYQQRCIYFRQLQDVLSFKIILVYHVYEFLSLKHCLSTFETKFKNLNDVILVFWMKLTPRDLQKPYF